MPRPTKAGGANSRSYRLTDHTLDLLPYLGINGNATDGIESLVRSLPSILEAYQELSRGNQRQQAIAQRLDEQLGVAQWDSEMQEIEILNAQGEAISWVV